MNLRGMILFLALWASQAAAFPGNNAECIRNQPGTFAYYKLVIFNTPESCIANLAQKNSLCSYPFLLQGLRPQCEQGFPDKCRLADYALLDQINEDALLDYFASRNQIRQEWERYGACTGLRRSAFFDLTVRLYLSIRLPEIPPGVYSDRQLLKLISKESGQPFSSDMVEFICDAESQAPQARPDTLDEIRFCLDRNGAPVTCLEQSRSCPEEIVIRAPE